MATNASSENYLETILMLGNTLPVVRSVDIANALGFKKSSVSIAMKNLREQGYITVTDAGFIYLTESGKAIADMIFERHEFLSKWLISLGVDSTIAPDDVTPLEILFFLLWCHSPPSFLIRHLGCAITLFNRLSLPVI